MLNVTPKVFVVIVENKLHPLTEIQRRGLFILFGQGKPILTVWERGCIAAVQWQGEARQLAEAVRNVLSDGRCQVTVLQLGQDMDQIGAGAQTEAMVALRWFLSPALNNS